MDIKWEKGQLTTLGVSSQSGKPLQLRYKGKIVTVQTIKNRTYRFDGTLNPL